MSEWVIGTGHEPVRHPRYPWRYCRVCGYVLGPRNSLKPCRGPVKLRPFERITPTKAAPLPAHTEDVE